MPDSQGRPAGSILAFDFGVKRIGVAVGEWPMAQAHPLTTIRSEANAERFAAIEALIKEYSTARSWSDSVAPSKPCAVSSMERPISNPMYTA